MSNSNNSYQSYQQYQGSSSTSGTKEFRYELEKGSKKHDCPGCGKKRFVYYVDTATGERLPEQYGRCDREINCGYWVNPYQDGYGQQEWEKDSAAWRQQLNRPKPTSKPASLIPFELFSQSKSRYQENNLALYLIGLMGPEKAKEVIVRYHLGTSRYRFANREFPGYLSAAGATVFWQMDSSSKIRGGKVMLYNALTGRRVKQPFNHITWAHKALKLEEYNLQQCFFGEHLLLQYPGRPVALVESEKTAMIASVYLPSMVWLAAGSLVNISAERCKVLRGKTVRLFPDLNGFEKWLKKAEGISKAMPGTLFEVSELLERHATDEERAEGLDLADYLTRYELEQVQQASPPQSPLPAPLISNTDPPAIRWADRPGWLEFYRQWQADSAQYFK